MSRYWTDPDCGRQVSGLPHPMAGLGLWRDGRLIADLEDRTDVAEDDAPVAVWQAPLEPGVYALRQTISRGAFEATVVVSAGWVTQVVVRRTTGLGGAFGLLPPPVEGAPAPEPEGPTGPLEPDDVAVFMRRPGARAHPERDDVVEAARVALVQGRDVFARGRGGELRTALLEQYDDPIAGIIGAHLLLRSVGGRTGPGREAGPEYDRVVQRLRTLVGDAHPDVEALSLRCRDRSLQAGGPFGDPPAFAESWQLIVSASYEPGRADLVPDDVWSRVHANTTIGPFLVWAVDEQRRADHLGQLAAWINACRGPVPEEVGESARRRGIPAAATAALWGVRPPAPA